MISPTADLPTMISLLKDLAALAEGTLQSVSHFFSSSPPEFLGSCRCPFNPHHRMPPESLFRHSLICPSAPGAPLLDLGFLETLRYPASLKSEAHLQKENRFVRPLGETDAELCFSIDGELGHLGSNFFYRDCPGVVTTPEPDASSRTFTLPGILSRECANFISDHNGGSQLAEERRIRILPSELWTLRREVEAWKEYPTSYSYTVLQVASCLPMVEEGCLKKWVISNSPCYGILIDTAMRDHIFLLQMLCLKAIGREARSVLDLLLSKDRLLDPRSLSFECPRLVGSLTWLASQLSVLYGETNGKFFTIRMLKESLRTGSSSSLIVLGQDKAREDVCCSSMGAGDSGEVWEFAKAKSVRDLELERPLEGSSTTQVFVSQVAAAVAALHERFLLEERIKMLRFGQPLSKYRLLSEYSYASTRGCEERGKRPNYRAVLEHDGLHWQRVQNQDQGKAKTREELLAEERDYKRRRMSYRGKKVKRTPTQVVRDIIEDHMEEIKQAGGIGCNLNAAADTGVLPLEFNSLSTDTRESQRKSYGPIESSLYKNPLYAEYTFTPRKHEDVSRSDRSSKSHDLRNSHQKLRYEHAEHWEDHKRSKHESEKNYKSRSPLSHRSYAHFHEQYVNQKERGDMDEHKTKNDRTDSRSWGHNSRATLTLKSAKGGYNFISDTRSKDRDRASDSRRSDSVKQNAFEDRYDPSVSYDRCGATYDDDSIRSNYLQSDVFHSPNDAKYHDELQRNDRATQRHYQDHQKI